MAYVEQLPYVYFLYIDYSILPVAGTPVHAKAGLVLSRYSSAQCPLVSDLVSSSSTF